MDELLVGFAVLLRDEQWKRDAACVEHPDVEFFPERGATTDPAKRLCGHCLVRDDCLDYALDNDIIEGVWGGLSGRERRRVRRDRVLAA